MFKNNLDDFYVGVIDLFYEMRKNELNNREGTFDNFIEYVEPLKKSDAILLEDNFKKLVHRMKFLSIFLKKGDKYIGLHDGVLYDENEIYNKCSNMYLLKKILPKADFYIPEKIDINDALYYFKLIFIKKKGVKNLLIKEKHSLNELYYGLYPLQQYIVNNDEHVRVNYIEKKQIENVVDAKQSYFLREEANFYKIFPCAFLKTNDGIINLCNNQFYSEEESQKIELEELESYFDREKIKHDKVITLSKVIKKI